MGWGPSDLSAKTGVAMPTISAITSRGSDRSNYKDALIKGFPADRISHAWLRDETGAMVVSRGGQPHVDTDTNGSISTGTEDNIGVGSTLRPILAWEHPDDLPEGEFVLIPRLDVHLSAGGGREQMEIVFVEQQPQAFRADWIRKKRLKPKKLASMTADGDSMEDRIQHGDALVVDTSQTEIVDGKVYAIWYDGGERVKRLYRLPGGGLRIKSDNDRHPTIEVLPTDANHVRIIGRVVHVAGEGGL